MNTKAKIKPLKKLSRIPESQGFTLIELLIVVLILGILAAIALPNLLGQVAKGRQAEAKNNLGALNRAQQAYRLEELTFSNVEANLPVKLSWKYYSFGFTPTPSLQSSLTYYAQALPSYQDDILDYAAGVQQDSQGEFSALICEEKSLNANNNSPPVFVSTVSFGGFGGSDTIECDAAVSKKIK